MKKHLHLLAALLGFASFAFAADHKSSSGSAANADDYPLKTCVVSDEPLGSMGETTTYTHREAGKPDRVIRFCCEGCVEDFRQSPEKFLKKLDDAKAAAAKKKSPGKKKAS